MPVILPNGLPANGAFLTKTSSSCRHPTRAHTQDIRPLRILALNLMPTKITTETQIARLLANSPLQVELTLLQTASHRGRHVSGDHLDAFYKTFEEVENGQFDGMIITGAPVEQLDFHEVNYWEKTQRHLRLSLTHAYSTLHVLGRIAALWHHYGIRKHPLAESFSASFESMKCFALPTRSCAASMTAFSSHTPAIRASILKDPSRSSALRLLASGRRTGPLPAFHGKRANLAGHPEYDLFTLDAGSIAGTLKKDSRFLFLKTITRPTDPAGVRSTAQPLAAPLYHNWLNYYVYQTTPYD